eukprot:scaffold13285_cov19-Tisochrysis_lutea.AAC.1
MQASNLTPTKWGLTLKRGARVQGDEGHGSKGETCGMHGSSNAPHSQNKKEDYVGSLNTPQLGWREDGWTRDGRMESRMEEGQSK